MKAVVFSKFPGRYFEETIRPKLRMHGVDVLKVVNPERNVDCNISDCEAVITLTDLMGHSDTQRVKKIARQYNKRLIKLERKEAGWSKILEAPPPVSTRAPANDTRALPWPTIPLSVPPSVPPQVEEEEEAESSVEQQLAETKELLGMYEEENEKLVEEKVELIERLKRSDDLAGGLERQLNVMEKEKEKWENLASSMESAAKSHQSEVLKLQIKARDLETQLANKASDVFSEALQHFKALKKLGFITNEEIIQKILKD